MEWAEPITEVQLTEHNGETLFLVRARGGQEFQGITGSPEELADLLRKAADAVEAMARFSHQR